jgi:hypothetical protein
MPPQSRKSISTGQPVVQELIARLPASLELTIFALLISVDRNPARHSCRDTAQ